MRLIGRMSDKSHASVLSDYLLVQGIANDLEPESDHWTVWVHSEDDVPRASAILGEFLRNPAHPQFAKDARRAPELRERQQKESLAAQEKHFDSERLFRATLSYGMGMVTALLIAISVGVALLTWFSSGLHVAAALVLSLPEVMRGQVWRLITPIFLHGGVLHLLFNMLWLFDLGSMVEGRQSSRHLVVLVVVIAVLSNLGEYAVTGPGFGGMSGVVYGLLGYVWMKGKFDPASGFFLHPYTVGMMLIWFFVCLFGLMGNVANMAHGVGLAVGILWGFLASGPWRR
jgi:GlpG protein